MIIYPDSEAYIRAVQNPATAFTIPRLRSASFAVDPFLQIPMPASGTRAIVFRASIDGDDRALRFYTVEEDAQTRRRYTTLGQVLDTPELRPHVATAAWTDNAITVRQQRWPMVEMQWVEGRTLDTYVDHLAQGGHSGSLATLADEWRTLIKSLQGAGFAHGDLQHGNVLIDMQSKLRLVDFDGSWVESFRSLPPPSEVGHPNYQPRNREWGRWMDTFPGLVVYTALLGLSRSADRWSQDWTQDKILFVADDFTPPFRTSTWEQLAAIGDPQVRHAVAALQHCCQPGWLPTGPLEDILTERPPPGLPQTEQADPRPTAPPGQPWWVATGAAPSAGLPPPPPIPEQTRSGPEQSVGTNTGSWQPGTNPGGWRPASTPPPTPTQPHPPVLMRPWGSCVAGGVGAGFLLALVVAALSTLWLADHSGMIIGAIAGGIFALLMIAILRRPL